MNLAVFVTKTVPRIKILCAPQMEQLTTTNAGMSWTTAEDWKKILFIIQEAAKVSERSQLTRRNSFYSTFRPFLSPPIHPSIHPPIHPSIHPPRHPYIHQFIQASINPSIHPGIHILINPSIYTFMYPPIFQSIHQLFEFSSLFKAILFSFYLNNGACRHECGLLS